MKGILLAGGSGTRLYPLNQSGRYSNKQLLGVYDKPMVYYPLTTLIECGIREVAVVTTPYGVQEFKHHLGDGSSFGMQLTYFAQARPNGIAEAFRITETYIAGDSVALILGDNIFSAGDSLAKSVALYTSGAQILAIEVANPSRYGVIELAPNGAPVSIEEKPLQPKSNLVVPGFYVFDSHVAEIAKLQKKSKRGEYEITDIIRHYMDGHFLTVTRLPRVSAWFDAGTPESLHDAAAYVQAIERRHGYKVGCPEEAAWRAGFIGSAQLSRVTAQMPPGAYRAYLENLR